MQEIIVYRNPAEAAIWHVISNSEIAFPVIVGLVAFIPAFLFFGWMFTKICSAGGWPRNVVQKFTHRFHTQLTVVCSIITSIIVVHSLMI